MSDSSRVSRAMANARRLSSEARFTDDAIRHVLGIDRVQRAALPAPKVSLPRVAFLEKPLPPWWNDPIFTQPLCRTRQAQT
jgi:hypothetical protein